MPLTVRTQLPVVVYLDDEPANRQAFEYALLDHATVHAFGDPRTALLAISRMPSVDVVVADLILPGMNGVEFLTQVAKINPTATRIIVTALNEAWPVVVAMNQGVVHHCYDRVEAFKPGKLEKIVAEAVATNITRSFETRLLEALPVLLERMAAAGEGWRTGLILARASRALKMIRLLLPYLDLPIQARVDLLLSGLFCNLASEVLDGLPGWEQVQATLEDRLEMWDGSGPGRKEGSQIPLLAQILGVVIGFDNWMMALRGECSRVEERIDLAVVRLVSEVEVKYARDVIEVFLQTSEGHRAELERIFSA